MEFGFGLLRDIRENENGSRTDSRFWHPYLAAVSHNNRAMLFGFKLTADRRFESNFERGHRQAAPGQTPEDAVLPQGQFRF